MANWAIVIGLDRYWTERASLKNRGSDLLEHPRAKIVDKVFKRHLSGSMWSVWRPAALGPGRKLTR